MSFDKFIKYEALTSLAFGAISSTYADIGVPLIREGDDVLLVNTTDITVIASFDDGTTDAVAIPSGGSYAGEYLKKKKILKKGSQVQIKDNGTGATSGNVFLTVEGHD